MKRSTVSVFRRSLRIAGENDEVGELDGLHRAERGHPRPALGTGVPLGPVGDGRGAHERALRIAGGHDLSRAADAHGGPDAPTSALAEIHHPAGTGASIRAIAPEPNGTGNGAARAADAVEAVPPGRTVAHVADRAL